MIRVFIEYLRSIWKAESRSENRLEIIKDIEYTVNDMVNDTLIL